MPARSSSTRLVELSALQSATHFVVATSTFGDGEFPDNANLFWEAISAATDRLAHLSFAVLAHGDVSYDHFCNAGRLLDERLEALAATRLVDRIDIDGFYEQPAAAWTTDVVKLLDRLAAKPASSPPYVAGLPPETTRSDNSERQWHNRKSQSSCSTVNSILTLPRLALGRARQRLAASAAATTYRSSVAGCFFERVACGTSDQAWRRRG
jgi:sulfite reductase (NADPH) flavoprotein alpha-component